ncbi:MAG: hypothetical protein GTN86_10835 [Xanthomonadales bacterium]|nr:hypothetical protein [Xanthomonadales bacterium]NIN58645.1 hypothetical protein [Xanthomonadales bacterium]NIN73934.1 hypothetical protein [Xanthomonadales bacterium]NIO12403.1 hypothetical protein [Xanthomonadales bacterium]NIP11038.1 hypothetical protein [Xanthomonadales bacterium]
MGKISVHTDHFSDAAQALDEIEAAGWHVVEMDVPAVRNESHWHTFSTRIYILEGVLNITDSARDRVLQAGPGSRVDVPARVLHSEDSAGYRIVAGMSVDPATLIGPIDLDPADL